MNKNKNISMNELLTREKFKELGFKRTNGMCCVPNCPNCAVDAHHIMDRKLWSNGGYYLSNCAPLCEQHHIDAEKGVYTPYEVMTFANISVDDALKPDKLNWLDDAEYKYLLIHGDIDKWGK